MLSIVSLPDWLEGVYCTSLAVHSASHRGNETVDTVRFLDERNEGCNPAFVASGIFKVRKDELLKRVYLILEVHQVVDGFVAFIGVIDSLQANVLFILKHAVELCMILVKA